MKLVTYRDDAGIKIGVLLEDQVIDLASACQALVDSAAAPEGVSATFPSSMTALLREGEHGLAKVRAILDFVEAGPTHFSRPVEAVTFLPPVLGPGKVIGLGLNYAAHIAEGIFDPPQYPVLFHKTSTALLGAGGTIVIPAITEQVDYEGELAVILGRTCKQVTADEALDYVAGYAIANDVSARDLQRRTSQFTAGKMLDTFGPLGPALVTRNEIADPGDLTIRTRLNGRLMQDGHTSDMIFDVPFAVSYISHLTTLEVGDVILTGTPEGVGYPRKPPVFLQDGDVVSVEIEGLGVLTNTVRRQVLEV